MGKNQFGEVMNERGYTSWPKYQADLASTSNVYATLTHPSGPTPWYNDDDSAYRDTELIELNGGDGDAANGNNRLDGIHAHLRFLNDGWQISPLWNSDMHAFYRGDEQAKGYGVFVDKAQWKPGSYRATLRNAVRRHSTFNAPGSSTQ